MDAKSSSRYTADMNTTNALVLAAVLLTAGVAFAQVPAPPPPQDRTEAGSDAKEVARAIAALKPTSEQYEALLKSHKEARNALKLREKAAARALYADFDAQAAKLKADQAAEKQDMIARMRQP